VIGIGIEVGRARKGGSGLLGGARGTPWRAAVCLRPLSGGHESGRMIGTMLREHMKLERGKRNRNRQRRGDLQKRGW
jgi:hypothetical protein